MRHIPMRGCLVLVVIVGSGCDAPTLPDNAKALLKQAKHILKLDSDERNASNDPFDEQLVFTYTNNAGHEVFHGDYDHIPLQYRSRVRVKDFNGVSLNAELGDNLDAQLEKEHQRLSETAFCNDAQAALTKPWWKDVWEQYGHFVVIAAALLIFLAFSPLILRHVEAAIWARFIGFAIPILLASGIVVHIFLSATRVYRSQLKTASLCDPSQIPKQNVTQRIHVVSQLKKTMALAERQRQHALDEAIGPGARTTHTP